MYVAIDRKPVNDYEIKNLYCGRSQIMLQIKIIETVEEDQHTQESQD